MEYEDENDWELIFNTMNEFWVKTITSVEQLKFILDKGYNLIEWNVNLSGLWLTNSVMSEFGKYSYSIVGDFTCNNNKLTSFDGFPDYCNNLSCTWNNITSIWWIPFTDGYTLDNKFLKLEELVEGKLYKYWDDFFLLENASFLNKDIDFLKGFDSIIDNNSTPILQNLKWLNLGMYNTSLKLLYSKYVHAVWNVVQFNSKLYLKDILDPKFYKNWWNIDSIEIKNIGSDVIEINWKKFNKKLSKLLK